MTNAFSGVFQRKRFEPIGTYTWAAKPDASAVSAGQSVIVSDVGISGYEQFVSDGALWLPVSGSLVLAQSSTNVSIIEPAATFTSLSYGNNGGKVQFTSAGVHSLTTSPAVGKNVHVTWTSGTGTTGLYKVLSVDSTTTLTIDLAHASGLGTPTVKVLNNVVTLATATIPAGLLGANGQLEVETLWSFTNSANNKVTKLLFGTLDLNTLTVTTNATMQNRNRIANRASEAVQIGFTPYTASGDGQSTSALSAGTEDTSAAVTLTWSGTPAAANEYIAVESFLVIAYSQGA